MHYKMSCDLRGEQYNGDRGDFMYQKMYYTLFNAMTDALQAMGEQNYGTAREILEKAQQAAEEIFLDADE